MTNHVTIPYSGYGNQGLQVFTPYEILTATAGAELDVSTRKAVRVADEAAYKLKYKNGTESIEGMMPVGPTGIARDVVSLIFTATTIVEVM